MPFELPQLPYELDALEPYISKETLEYHYGQHHQTYVNKLNTLLQEYDNREVSEQSLEEIIIRLKEGPIFNNAAQAWNHEFYWHCMKPALSSENTPEGALLMNIQRAFDSLESFKETFFTTAITLFGSGWAWLVKNKDGKLEILSTSNADNPMIQEKKPLLTCDVWEHAYYIDTRNNRPKYVNNFWALVNWDFVAKNFES